MRIDKKQQSLCGKIIRGFSFSGDMTIVEHRRMCESLSEEISAEVLYRLYPHGREQIIEEMLSDALLNNLDWDEMWENITAIALDDDEVTIKIKSLFSCSPLPEHIAKDCIFSVLKPAFRRIYPEGVTEYDYSLEQTLGIM